MRGAWYTHSELVSERELYKQEDNIRFLYRLHNCIKYYYTDDCRIQITLTISTNNRNIQIEIDFHKVQNTTQMLSRINIILLRNQIEMMASIFKIISDIHVIVKFVGDWRIYWYQYCRWDFDFNCIIICMWQIC